MEGRTVRGVRPEQLSRRSAPFWATSPRPAAAETSRPFWATPPRSAGSASDVPRPFWARSAKKARPTQAETAPGMSAARWLWDRSHGATERSREQAPPLWN
ncbi:hypothetical protein [Planomonospora sp. ID82291]|uniref:hypothetical protein n=1 Tax=Planomonospora sp. ID82291 TaxID=2738136 RepID=UPI0018C42407|nr:hypothetical protein [Planomonospora sp. ID82291]